MVNSYYYIRGGAERCFFDLSDLLRSHGHEVIPFCMDHPMSFPSEFRDDFVSYIDFPTELGKSGLGSKFRVVERAVYSREARRKIEAVIKKVQPELVHIHGFAQQMSTSILPPLKAAGLPVIQTLHDYKMVCPNSSFASHGRVCEACKGGKYYNMTRYRCKRGSLSASLLASVEMYFHEAFRLYEPNIDLFISPSQFLAGKMVEHGIKTPIITIPNFIRPDSFQPVYESGNYYIYAGRLSSEKGIRTLLSAVQRIKTDVELVIAGSGELEQDLRQFVQDNNLNNVRFVGHLNTTELSALMQRAICTVVPSECYENYSMTVIESLACGTPVIGARIGGIPEQVIHGENGLLFEPGDAESLAVQVQRMLDNRDEALEMGRIGRDRIELINGPIAHYDQTMAAYRSILPDDASRNVPEFEAHNAK